MKYWVPPPRTTSTPRARYWAAIIFWSERFATVVAKPAGVACVAVAVVTSPQRFLAAFIFWTSVTGLRPSGVMLTAPLLIRSPMPQQLAAAAESVTMPLAESVSQSERTTGRSAYIFSQWEERFSVRVR